MHETVGTARLSELSVVKCSCGVLHVYGGSWKSCKTVTGVENVEKREEGGQFLYDPKYDMQFGQILRFAMYIG